MSDTAEASTAVLDILADLIPAANQCPVVSFRHDRPDLAEQFDRIIAFPPVRTEGKIRYRHSAAQIADWFVRHGAPTITGNLVARHRRGECRQCLTTS